MRNVQGRKRAGATDVAEKGATDAPSSLTARDDTRLAESEQRFRDLYNHAPDMYHTLDLAGNFVEFNPRHTEILGYASDELLGNHISCIMTEEMLPRLAGDFGELMDTGSINGREYVLRKKDGSLMTVEVHANRFDRPSGEHWEVRCTMRDVTERKRLEEQLQQAQKMEVVGQLAGGIAHDFNNLLTVIKGYTQLAMASDPSDEELPDYLEQIHAASERASQLTKQLLGFSRRQIVAPTVMNLNDVILGTEQMLRRLISESIELTLGLDEALGQIRMDPIQVEQVLVNLAVNAGDAMPGGGTLTIQTCNESLTKRQAARYPGLVPGEYVRLVVSDTGVGMDDVTRRRVFEPFFTTKKEGAGTGLGLSMCYGILRQNDGHISVDAQPNQGSVFTAFVPRVREELTPVSTDPEVEDSAAGTETILVVEDDAQVRGLAVAVLRRHGYTVLPAAHGREALTVAEEHDGVIHLLLTDVVMPHMSVKELTDQMEKSRPGLKVLFASGYTDDALIRQGVRWADLEFIGKPYSPSDLLRRVRKILST
jgi:two-component system cell cycle sensor histidine kinase/response regulator CckA